MLASRLARALYLVQGQEIPNETPPQAYVGVAGASVVRAPPTGLGTGAPGVAAPATPTSGSEAGFSMSAAVGVAAGAGAEGGSTHRYVWGGEGVSMLLTDPLPDPVLTPYSSA